MRRSQLLDPHTIADSIDAVLLAPQLTEAETVAGCEEAKMMGLASVIVKPCFVRQAVDALRGSEVRVGTVIGFPHGSNTAHIKLSEAKRALTECAVELIVVGNLGYLKAGAFDRYREDLKGVLGLAHMNGARVKVVLEMGFLTESETLSAVEEVVRLNADWVVASTGFCSNNPTLRDVKTLIKVLDGRAEVAMMAGVTSLQDVQVFLEDGCTRVGSSAPGDLLADLI